MEIEKFAQTVVEDFSKEITDLVFLYIENDKKLMHEYLRLISVNNLDTVNKSLGKKIKEKFNVENIGRSNDTRSKLIQSYTQHTAPK